MAAMVQNPRDVESSSNILTNGNHGTKEATEASSSSSYSSSATTSTIKTRREALSLATKATTATALALATTTTTFLLPQNANAETTASTSQIQLLDQQSSRFKRIPLFAIVSSTTGTPFMILQNTGRAQAYFFTTYDGAQLVLSDAIRDAADKDLSTVNMWNEAKISAVNLELVLKLNKNKGRYKALAQNNVKYEAVYDVIPSIKALNDAERIDKSGMYSERGRVPLFYANDFQLESTSSNAGSASGSPGSSGSGSGDGDGGKLGRIPVFFEKADLLREYTKKYPDKTDVVITVVDLMDLFEVMMGNKPIGAKVDDTIIDRMVFVPTGESRKRAIECEKGRGAVSAYKVGEMIAVGGK
eukprot:CAMPEP_0203666028 /NCGR_PEP_ID=MMETSP0090-20130426/3159_1 /ASSEMBLY_ACC=CAM_ASM_001088 /TAXON_ID=426623 /ORGANISM="Chaetoceros affinis, Strain CCMP159" /LENGTH=357 /DNA_ID=CAMNT_0050529807 /DNA_START=85 /DNA_END=1158 /DNA_ORIENTATION=+